MTSPRPTETRSGEAARSLRARAAKLERAAAGLADLTRDSANHSVLVASAAGQLLDSVEAVGQNLALTAEFTEHAVELVRHADTVVAGLHRASQEFEKTAAFVNAIESQANMIALDAAIEAARHAETRSHGDLAKDVVDLAKKASRASEAVALSVSGLKHVAHGSVSAINCVAHAIRALSDLSTAASRTGETVSITARETASRATALSAAALGMERKVAEILTEVAAVLDAMSGIEVEMDRRSKGRDA